MAVHSMAVIRWQLKAVVTITITHYTSIQFLSDECVNPNCSISISLCIKTVARAVHVLSDRHQCSIWLLAIKSKLFDSDVINQWEFYMKLHTNMMIMNQKYLMFNTVVSPAFVPVDHPPCPWRQLASPGHVTRVYQALLHVTSRGRIQYNSL